jgi:hypothetical protein
MWKIKKYYKESRMKEHTTYNTTKEGKIAGSLLCSNCCLKHVIEEKLEGTGR